MRAVTDRAPGEPLIPALRQEIHALVRHCTAPEAAPVRSLIVSSPALREYEGSMRMRHADTLAAAIAADLGVPETSTACRTIARFVIDAYALACEAAEPEGAVDEVFRMIEAAWDASRLT